MLFYIGYFMGAWLLPPGIILVFTLLGLLLWSKWPKAGKIVVSLSLLALWLLSTPMIAQQLTDKLQFQYTALSPNKLKPEKGAAIVVLEAGLNIQTPEYGYPTLSEATLARIRYAAFLYKKTGIPILVSGNDPSQPSINQTDYMAKGLQDYFNIPTKWKEDKGYNTAQEGIYTVQILQKAGITKIYLVTHALHMPRSVYAFQNKGLVIIPAPTAYVSFERNLGKLSDYLPSAKSLSLSSAALHEYIGLLWYRWHYRVKPIKMSH